MKNLSYVILSILAAVASSPAASWAGPTAFQAAPDARAADYREFLIEIGFRQYAQQLQASLDRGDFYTDAGQFIQQFQMHRYRVFDDARELAVNAMSRLERSPGRLEAIIDFTARIAGLQPIAQELNFPAEIQAMPKGPARESAVREHLKRWTEDMIRQDTDRYLADYVSAVVGSAEYADMVAAQGAGQELSAAQTALNQELLQTRRQITQLVAATYLEAEMGMTRYAGRALTASLVKYAQDRERAGEAGVVAQVEASLTQALAKQGLRFDNIIGSHLTLPSRQSASGLETVEVHHGDAAFERSVGLEAGRLSWAAVINPRYRAFGGANELYGRLLAAILPRDWSAPQRESTLRNVMDRVAKSDKYNSGFSHVGRAEVLQSQGVSMVWFRDLYPGANSTDARFFNGGIRVSGIENFSLPGPFNRFGLMHYDPRKLLAEAKRQARLGPEHYQTVVREGAQVRIVDNAPIIDKQAPRKGYAVQPTWAEFVQVLDVSDTQEAAQKWMDERVDRASSVYEEFFNKGLAFDEHFGNSYGGAFCSLTYWMSFAIANGLDVEPYPDHWNQLVKVLKRLVPAKLASVDTDSRIIAPDGLAASGADFGELVAVDYPKMDDAASARAQTRVAGPLREPALLDTVRDWQTRQGLAMDPETAKFEDTFQDWLDSEVEARMNMVLSSINIQTKDRSVFRMVAKRRAQRLRGELDRTRQALERDAIAICPAAFDRK